MSVATYRYYNHLPMAMLIKWTAVTRWTAYTHYSPYDIPHSEHFQQHLSELMSLRTSTLVLQRSKQIINYVSPLPSPLYYTVIIIKFVTDRETNLI